MITEDGRQIVSCDGHHPTEKKRKAVLTTEQWEKWEELEQQIAKRDTGTICIVLTGNQNRIKGTAGEINSWGHKEGAIGSTIDYCIDLGCFTKEQIVILSGSKISKINNHINYLRGKGFEVEISNNIVSFTNSK